MAIHVGIDCKIAFESPAEQKKAVGRSGAVRSYLTSEVANPEISSSYKMFTSPEKETAVITSVLSTAVA